MTHDPVVIVAPAIADLASADDFTAELAKVPDTADVLVECSEVEFMDSTGLGVMLTARNHHISNGGSLRVVSPSRPVLRLLEIAGVVDLVAD